MLKHFIDLAESLTVQLAQEEGENESLRIQLAEADRRAGEAERKLENANDTIIKSNQWRDKAKKEWGVDYNVSFDKVWAECLELRTKAQAEAEKIEWNWLIGKKLRLGTVIDICNQTATVRRGDADTRVLIGELIEEEFKAQERFDRNFNEASNMGDGSYVP